MKPTPSQKPHKVNKVTENCEEIRLLYVKLLENLIFINEDQEITDVNNIKDNNNEEFRIFIQDIVNISRTLIMDPCTNVVVEALNLTRRLCLKFGKELLLYFNSIISRALFYPLTSKQSKMRLSALDCLDALMICSPYKKNVEIMEQLIGFRDPNLVPIKDFYEPSTKLNYLALLVSDPSLPVLKRFFEVITGWLINLEDRFDHEARLIPYILSGLFSKHEEICLYVAQRLEDIGNQQEFDNEKDMRDNKQYGIDSPWIKHCSTIIEDNKGFQKVEFNKGLYYPFPIGGRPNFGSRLLIKKYLRRYIKNLCKEYESIEESIKIKVSNLILFSIIFAEDGVTEFLDEIILCFEREIVRIKGGRGTNRDSNKIIEPLYLALKFVGRYCDYDSVTKLIFPTLVGDLNANFPDIQKGALVCLKYYMIGHIESISNKESALGVFTNKIKEVVETINNKRFIEYMDSQTGIELIDFYLSILKIICEKKDNFGSSVKEEIIENLNLIFDHVIAALGSISIFDLHGASNVEIVNQVEKSLGMINGYIKVLFEEKKIQINSNSYFSMKVKETLNVILDYVTSNHLNLNSKYYKIFYVLLKQIKIYMKLDDFSNDQENLDMIKLTVKIFTKIFESSYNFPLHQHTIKLVTSYLNNSVIEIFSDSVLLINIYNDIIKLYSAILNPYEIEHEKFKFADILKDEKELEKKKLKSPKTAKSEIREKIFIVVKNLLNKNSIFSINSGVNNKEILERIVGIFDEKLGQDIIKDTESNRRLYVETYYLVFVKYFSALKKSISLKDLKENDPEFKFIKKIILTYEEYFNNEVFSSIADVRLTCLNTLNIILCAFERSEFFEPMSRLFSNFTDGKNMEQFNYETMKVLAYVEEENKKIDSVFKNFKQLFSIILNIYIDERISYGTNCEQIIKNVIDKFPIFCFNELTKARNKNQIARIELLDRMFSKYLKIK
jgi:hypothetical protein